MKSGYGIVLKSDPVEMDSVNTLTSGLVSLYEDLSKIINLRIIDVKDIRRRPPLSVNYAPLLIELTENPPEFIVVTHGSIFRSYFFRLLLMTLHKKQCRFYFHIYGDFVRQVDHWLSLEGMLLKKNVSFFLPSNAYQSVVRKLVTTDSTYLLPYSFALDEISGGTDQNTFCREDFDVTFVYSGRISVQKNIISVISLLDKVQSKTGLRIALRLIGALDDSEAFFNGANVRLGTNFNSIKGYHEISVFYEGYKKRDCLKSAYESADFYISLSHYHDDDFCLSAIEALSAGLPCIFTKWGGHLDLMENHFGEILGVPVTGERVPDLSDHTVEAVADFIIKHKGKRSDPSKLLQYFSQERIKSLIQNYLIQEGKVFTGFSDLMRDWSAEYRKNLYGVAYNDIYSSFRNEQ